MDRECLICDNVSSTAPSPTLSNGNNCKEIKVNWSTAGFNSGEQIEIKYGSNANSLY